jgi:hypothetical protein
MAPVCFAVRLDTCRSVLTATSTSAASSASSFSEATRSFCSCSPYIKYVMSVLHHHNHRFFYGKCNFFGRVCAWASELVWALWAVDLTTELEHRYYFGSRGGGRWIDLRPKLPITATIVRMEAAAGAAVVLQARRDLLLCISALPTISPQESQSRTHAHQERTGPHPSAGLEQQLDALCAAADCCQMERCALILRGSVHVRLREPSARTQKFPHRADVALACGGSERGPAR